MSMIILILLILFSSLILGIPMMIGMTMAAAASIVFFIPIDVSVAMQQLYLGVSPFVLLAVPMFMLAAEIMCMGECADRLLRFVKAFLGHLPGGIAITSIGTCTLFGAISGSTQATFVAVGRPMFKEMTKLGYKESHSIAMLMNSANIALLIPPSVYMIIYCVVVNASVAELFIAGIGPGLLLFLVFAAYEFFYAKRNNVARTERANMKEIGLAFKEALLPLGFPVIILGGIYAGIFSPTEAAAVSVVYAFVLEMFIYRSITMKMIVKSLVNIGMITASVFVLVGAGQALSWVLSYGGMPQAMARGIAEMGLSANGFLFLVAGVFFVACMFMDAIPVIYILAPIFAPIAIRLGIDPIHMGVLIVLQAAIGCVTPPFGCNIFTAMAIFDLPFSTVVNKLAPYVVMCVVTTIILILFPDIALFFRNMAFVG